MTEATTTLTRAEGLGIKMNKNILRAAWVLAAGLTLISCAKSPLDRLEQAQTAFQMCMVNRTENICGDEREAVELRKLEAIKAGLDTRQVAAAIELGNRKVEGNPADSPYAVFHGKWIEVRSTKFRANWDMWSDCMEEKNPEVLKQICVKDSNASHAKACLVYRKALGEIK